MLHSDQNKLILFDQTITSYEFQINDQKLKEKFAYLPESHRALIEIFRANWKTIYNPERNSLKVMFYSSTGQENPNEDVLYDLAMNDIIIVLSGKVEMGPVEVDDLCYSVSR